MTSDVNQLQNGVNLTLRLLLRSPFIVFGAMIMAFTVDVKAALIFVVAIPLLAIVVFGIMIVSMPLYKKVQAALDKILGRTRENLAGARVIRAFCNEASEMEAFTRENEQLLNVQVFVGKISAAMNPDYVYYCKCGVGGFALDGSKFVWTMGLLHRARLWR